MFEITIFQFFIFYFSIFFFRTRAGANGGEASEARSSQSRRRLSDLDPGVCRHFRRHRRDLLTSGHDLRRGQGGRQAPED